MGTIDMVTATCNKISDRENMRAKWGWFFALGCVLIILGVVAMGTPFVASMTIALFVGYLLLVSGVMQVIHALRFRKWGDFVGEILLSIISILVGIYMVAHPLLGTSMLTLILGVYIFIEGLSKIFIALRWKPLAGWGWGVLNGILAVIIGIMIVMRWPYDTLWIIGFLLGINFLFMGSTFITLGLTLRRLGSIPK